MIGIARVTREGTIRGIDFPRAGGGISDVRIWRGDFVEDGGVDACLGR